MKVCVQRVDTCKVFVEDKFVSSINKGLLILVGYSNSDILTYNKWMAEKVIGLRIFEDEDNKLSKNVEDINGEIMVVSNFTLYGTVKKGRRPDFTLSLKADEAKILYNDFILLLKNMFDENKVKTGIFGAKMNLELVNNGPVTIIIDYP